MTEQTLIANAMTISVFVAPICTFFNAKSAWDELRFIFFFLGLVSIKHDQVARAIRFCGLEDAFYKKRRPSKLSICKAIVLHGILMLFGIYFTIWGAIFTYECAKWIFNFIFGG